MREQPCRRMTCKSPIQLFALRMHTCLFPNRLIDWAVPSHRSVSRLAYVLAPGHKSIMIRILSGLVPTASAICSFDRAISSNSAGEMRLCKMSDACTP